MKKGYTIAIVCLLLALCVLAGLIYFDLFHHRDKEKPVNLADFAQAMQDIEDSRTIGGHLWIRMDSNGEPQLFRYDNPLTFTAQTYEDNTVALLSTTLDTEYITHIGYYELYYDDGWKVKLTDGKPVMMVEETIYHYDKMNGIRATLRAADKNASPTKAQLEAAKTVIEQRLIARNITAYAIDIDTANGEMHLDFPWTDTSNTAIREILSELTVQGTLQFYEGEGTATSGGESIPPHADKLILEGTDVLSATAMVNTDPLTSAQSPYVIALELSDAGAEKFAIATERLAANKGIVSVWLDFGPAWSKEYYKPRYQLLSAPTVESPITGGEAVITGFCAYEDAKEIADLITAGTLPFEVTTAQVSIIAATER